jgi:TonB family protein
VENAAPLGNYAAALVASISRNWRQQRQWANADLSVRISIRIERDGTFSAVRILTPSGNPSYDAAALSAVADHPIGPPLPEFIREAPITVTVVLVPRA